MKDRYTMIFPNYTIGVEAYEKIREVCPRYGKSVVVIGGRKGIEAAQEKMVRAVEGVGLEFTGFIHAGGQSSDENIERISEDSAVQEADMIFAVGGGKAIDTAKAVAHRQNKPYFTFPTVAGRLRRSGQYRDDLYAGWEVPGLPLLDDTAGPRIPLQPHHGAGAGRIPAARHR